MKHIGNPDDRSLCPDCDKGIIEDRALVKSRDIAALIKLQHDDLTISIEAFIEVLQSHVTTFNGYKETHAILVSILNDVSDKAESISEQIAALQDDVYESLINDAIADPDTTPCIDCYLDSCDHYEE